MVIWKLIIMKIVNNLSSLNLILMLIVPVLGEIQCKVVIVIIMKEVILNKHQVNMFKVIILADLLLKISFLWYILYHIGL